MRVTSLLLMTSILSQNLDAQPYKYPTTKKVDHKDNYFGKEISDPYRWLEDDNAADTKEWVLAQNSVTNEYLSKIPFRKGVKDRLTKLWNFPKSSSPFKAGNNYLIYTNNGLQNQFVLN